MKDNLVNPVTYTVQQEEGAQRLDTFIAQKFPTYSRTYFKELVQSQAITLNGKPTKASMSVKPDDVIVVNFPPAPELGIPKPINHDLGVKIVFEHEHFFIINKPAGLMCHAPTADSPEITLVDWLLTLFADLRTVGSQDRPGIVHRLDKDTSGLMIIPRNNYAHMTFADMFKNRQISKTYHAVVKGKPLHSGTIDYPIDRHPIHKNKMTHITDVHAYKWHVTGRQATTHYNVIEQFNDYALIEAKPVTGRTHQIRVHCAAIGHGLLGDSTYGHKSPFIQRQALHAYSLSFEFEGKQYSFTQEAPQDFKELVDKLRTF